MQALTLAARVALWIHAQPPDIIHDRLVTDIITELVAFGDMSQEIEQDVTFPTSVLWALIDADVEDEYAAATANAPRTFQLIGYSPPSLFRPDNPADEPPRVIYKRPSRPTERPA
ncbi:MAG: hypothetical protein EB020_10605 [Proteobacteria bacterium]|nr:hypothetical protein [Pseudomonadota bacterium]